MCQITAKKRKKKQKITLVKKIKLEEKKTPSFIQASRIGDLETIKKHVENGADVNEQVVGCTALHYACFYNHLEIVEFLIQKGAEIDIQNSSGVTPFYWAVDSGNFLVAKFLIDKCDPSIPDKFGYSPLHRAVMNKNFELVELLLSVNTEEEIWVPLNERTVEEQFTALHFACLSQHFAIVELLLKHGANVNCLSGTRSTPLHYAVCRNYSKIVELLLLHGADLNIMDCEEKTPLHWACLIGHTDMAKVLIEASANKNLRDRNAETAFDLATKYSHSDIVTLLTT